MKLKWIVLFNVHYAKLPITRGLYLRIFKRDTEVVLYEPDDYKFSRVYPMLHFDLDIKNIPETFIYELRNILSQQVEKHPNISNIIHQGYHKFKPDEILNTIWCRGVGL